MTFATLPDRRAAEAADGACIDDDRVELTNAQFALRVRAAAAALAALGVRRGDVVATVLSNGVEFVVTMFAAWHLGAALTPVNPALTAAEVGYQLTDSAAKVVVAEGTIAAPDGVAVLAVDELPEVPNEAVPPAVVDAAALALLIYTSGTTGSPKGVMLEHGNLTAMVEMVTEAVHLSAADHCLLILPLFHVNGIIVSLLAPLAVGGATTITGRFAAASFFDTIEAVRPTYFSAVPTIYAMLANLPADTQPDTSSVRLAVCGAAPMPAELIHRFEARYGIPLIEGYGLSECTCAATLNPLDGVRKPGTVGLPLPGEEVALRDRDGHIGTGGTGEVVLRGPNVMRGYLNRPEATAEVLVGGWLRTGDIGYLDEDGYLVLVDRAKDMIIRGGENIYPKEIESVLYRHPAVAEAAVVGRPHEVFGEEPVAFVALRPGVDVTADELTEHCYSTLARFKVPRSVVILDSLPKNAVGKLIKLPLRELVRTAARP